MEAACCHGDLKTVESLLRSGYNVNEDALHEPPLVLASYGGHSELMEYLIQKGADVNAYGDDGHTALHVEAEDGNTQMVKLLHDIGADIQTVNSRGFTALHSAVAQEQVSVTKYLVSQGVKINAKSDFGCTPLHDSCVLEIVKYLLSHGAKICKDYDELTPLGRNYEFCGIEIARYLVFYGDIPDDKVLYKFPQLKMQCTLKDLKGSKKFLGNLIYTVLM